MAQVANNADDYAAARQNIFFPGIIPSLDGQCASLVKWFMAEMSSIPNPQAARGDARYVGNVLVVQGYAVEVPYVARMRGDIICYEYGQYGHTAVQLSDGRVFEENVNLGGVQSKIVDGARVYASRIGSESEAWRAGLNPHIYRLKSYNETGEVMTKEELTELHWLVMGAAPGPAYLAAFTGQSVDKAMAQLQGDPNRLQVIGLMDKAKLTRLHRLAMGSEPGPAYLEAFDGSTIDKSMKQLEGDPNRLNIKPNLVATPLAPGTYQVK